MKLLSISTALMAAWCVYGETRAYGADIVSSTVGTASYYSDRFHGRRTANGERYNKNALTAAHRKLKFGTHVVITNLLNNKKVKVRINDRGPYHKRRLIDLSHAAAQKIGLLRKGVGKVRIDVVK